LPDSIFAPMPASHERSGFFHKFRQTTIFTDGGGDFQAAGQRHHPADVRIKQINRLELSRRTFASKFTPPVFKPPYFKMAASSRSLR